MAHELAVVLGSGHIWRKCFEHLQSILKKAHFMSILDKILISGSQKVDKFYKFLKVFSEMVSYLSDFEMFGEILSII